MKTSFKSYVILNFMQCSFLVYGLFVSTHAQAQTVVISKHCSYLSKYDPKACNSSTYCKFEKNQIGVCKSNKQEQIFQDICAQQSGFPDLCKQNSTARCQFEMLQHYTCMPKM